MLAPRRFANSSSSITRIPAPSPTTNPSRSLSHGRDARCGSSLRCERARMAANPPMPMGVMHASAPPQIITSAASRWITLKEWPMGWELEEVGGIEVLHFSRHAGVEGCGIELLDTRDAGAAFADSPPGLFGTDAQRGHQPDPCYYHSARQMSLR